MSSVNYTGYGMRMKEITLDDGTDCIIVAVSWDSGSSRKRIVLMTQTASPAGDELVVNGKEFGDWLTRHSSRSFYNGTMDGLAKEINHIEGRVVWKKTRP